MVGVKLIGRGDREAERLRGGKESSEVHAPKHPLYQIPPAPSLYSNQRPNPQTLHQPETFFKLVAVEPDGRHVSIFDGRTEYSIGEPLSQETPFNDDQQQISLAREEDRIVFCVFPLFVTAASRNTSRWCGRPLRVVVLRLEQRTPDNLAQENPLGGGRGVMNSKILVIL
jgi:hypothetical protein